MDGVWLPAGGRRPGDRGFPGSRHTLRPGVKGAWPYAPLPPPPSGRLANHISRQRAERTNRHRLFNRPTRAEDGGLRSTQPTLPDASTHRTLLFPMTPHKTQSRLSGRVEGWMEPVRGQDDRKRERHAMDGVWLPAGGRRPGARGIPGSRHTLGPGIVKGEAFSPLTRRRPPQVGKTPLPTRRNRITQIRSRL
jgi:hypothetical protein